MRLLITTIIQSLIIIVPLLISVAYFTLVERKVMGSIQRRRGPNVVGVFGLLQPLADGLKLFVKENVIPSTSNKNLFVLAPLLTFFLSFLGWAVIPVCETSVLGDLNIGLLYLLAMSSLGVYGIIMAGWASNSKYAFLGSLRSTAQMISYEISLGLIFLSVIICAGSINLSDIILAQENVWYCIPLFPMFITASISILAETNRHPFDLPEAEAELVAGYNVEYSGMAFALFFLGEYANMLLMSSIMVVLFLGGWLPLFNFLAFIPGPFWFSMKVILFVLFFVWARAIFPRYRYDQLMRLGWKVFLPFTFGWFILTATILYSMNWLSTPIFIPFN